MEFHARKLNKMNNTYFRFAFSAAAAFFCLTLFFSASAGAQRRDHLTEEESELVREMQEIDKRTEIYITAIDRRFSALGVANSITDKKSKKDSEKWGKLPKGTRTELLIDIERILQEAVDNIDGVAERDMKSELLPKAVHLLADAAKRFLPELKTFLDSAQNDKEKGAIIGAMDFCNQIVEASSKLPPEEKKKKKS